MKEGTSHLKYEFRYLSKEELPDVVEFMEDVYRTISTKETFSLTKKEELEDGLQRGSKLLGVYYGEKLVAFRYTDVPTWENNLARDISSLDIPPTKVAINDTVMVAKEHRGMKLQNITREKILKDMVKEGYTHFMSTISPKNPDSYKNTLDCGYIIVGLKKKYPDETHPEGKDRFILYASQEREFVSQGDRVKVNFDDLEKMKELFIKGYVGRKVLEGNQLLFDRVKIVEK